MQKILTVGLDGAARGFIQELKGIIGGTNSDATFSLRYSGRSGKKHIVVFKDGIEITSIGQYKKTWDTIICPGLKRLALNDETINGISIDYVIEFSNDELKISNNSIKGGITPPFIFCL